MRSTRLLVTMIKSFIGYLSMVNLGFIGSNLQLLESQEMDRQMSITEKDRLMPTEQRTSWQREKSKPSSHCR